MQPEVDGKKIRPKIVASTATVRRAENQIRALFNRRQVDIFPPPGPDRRDSFFAETHSPQQSNARLYVGIAAQGRSPKVVMLRTYLALLAAAQKAYDEAGRQEERPNNPADPYMTLLGYFNSLRELGGARRIVEDEVGNRLAGYGNRKRVGETEGLFANRKIAYEAVELTSRVSTDKVAEAKRRLALPFCEKDRVDVAIATNMISVGLDITRLGLMVVFGQPKTSAEYIQATSRVGRDHERPGLVRDDPEHPQAARPLALRTVRGLSTSRSTAASRRRASRRSRRGPWIAGWRARWWPGPIQAYLPLWLLRVR